MDINSPASTTDSATVNGRSAAIPTAANASQGMFRRVNPSRALQRSIVVGASQFLSAK